MLFVVMTQRRLHAARTLYSIAGNTVLPFYQDWLRLSVVYKDNDF